MDKERVKRLSASTLVWALIVGTLAGCSGTGTTPMQTYSVSGSLVKASDQNQGIPGATLSFSGGFGIAATDSDGRWNKDGLRGTVTVRPVSADWSFAPESRVVASASTEVDFAGTRVGHVLVPSEFPTIQTAIDNVRNGASITVSPGLYRENLDLRGKSVTVRSTNPAEHAIVAATVIDGGSSGPVVTFKNNETSSCVIEGFTITNGWGSSSNGHGGGIAIRNASPTIRYNVITGNRSASSGGGIYAYGGSPVIAHNTIAENGASNYGGGIHLEGASVSLQDNSLRSNSADRYGGGGVSANNSVLSMTGNTVELNHARGDSGGGIYATSCTLAIVDNRIANNTGGAEAGGIYVYLCQGEIRANVIAENSLAWTSSGWGGGAYLASTSGELVFSGNAITENTAYRGGGLVLSWPKGTCIQDNTITRNKATYGGGMYISKAEAATIVGNEISDNAASYGGGGGLKVVDSEFAMIRIANNRFERNKVDQTAFYEAHGGAIMTGSSGTQVVGNEFIGNSAISPSAAGGAIFVTSTGRLLDDQGRPLPSPDTYNTYVGNLPDDIYYE